MRTSTICFVCCELQVHVFCLQGTVSLQIINVTYAYEFFLLSADYQILGHIFI